MAIFISLLRGINVGGNKKIPMLELQKLYQALGLQSVQTLLQSGNVVFVSPSTNPLALAESLETGIANHFGFEVRIILRSGPEWQALVQNQPFPQDYLSQGDKVGVCFLAAPPSPEAIETLLASPRSEVVQIVGQELFVYYPDGMGRSKFDLALIERHLKVKGTLRNWNTVQKLLLLSQALAKDTAST